MPEAEVADMIVEIRSVTQGVGTYRTEFDHLQELVGRTADRIVEETKKRAAARKIVWTADFPVRSCLMSAQDARGPISHKAVRLASRRYQPRPP